jgi:hypothetical protein
VTSWIDARGHVVDGRHGGEGKDAADWLDMKLRDGLGDNAPDGSYFDKKTGRLTRRGQEAVHRFQQKEHIKDDGIIGRETARHLLHPNGPNTEKSSEDKFADSAYDKHYLTWKGDHYEGGEAEALKASLGHIAQDVIDRKIDLPDAKLDALKGKAEALQKELHDNGLSQQAVRLFEEMGADFKYRGRPVTDVARLGPGFTQLVLHFALLRNFEPPRTV